MASWYGYFVLGDKLIAVDIAVIAKRKVVKTFGFRRDEGGLNMLKGQTKVCNSKCFSLATKQQHIRLLMYFLGFTLVRAHELLYSDPATAEERPLLLTLQPATFTSAIVHMEPKSAFAYLGSQGGIDRKTGYHWDSETLIYARLDVSVSKSQRLLLIPAYSRAR